MNWKPAMTIAGRRYKQSRHSRRKFKQGTGGRVLWETAGTDRPQRRIKEGGLGADGFIGF